MSDAAYTPVTAAEPRPWRNRLSFGLGTLGRDMASAIVSLYLLYYLTDVIGIGEATLVAVTAIIVVMRIFDAVNDPFMGIIVDNTRSRWGRFKPWIAIGALLWAGSTVFMFVDTGLEGAGFLVLFTLVYLAWELSYTVNDIAYYGMLPSLSRSQKEREAIGVIARICANVGLFSVVIAILPVTNLLGEVSGSLQRGWLIFAIIVSALMLAFQLLTLFFTRERVVAPVETTPLREIFRVIWRNDQLLWVTLAMLLFMIGYTTTASLGIYYFKYVFGDEGMYPIFAAILGITQLAGLAIFPLLTRWLTRRQMHLLATVLCVAGLAVFFFGETSMMIVAIAGVLLFTGQAFIQLLMLLFIADCVEYGQWKLGRRNASITVSLQPFIYKASNAFGVALVGVALVWSGISRIDEASEMTAGGVAAFKIVMLLIPMILIAISWVILVMKYKLNAQTYAGIVADLRAREAEEREPVA